MKWGIAINLRETVSEIVEKAKLADAGGMDAIWVTDYPAIRLSPVVASAIAHATRQVRIGVGLLSPFIYSTNQIVQFMSTLIDYHGDRFDLLIGPGDKSRLADIGFNPRGRSAIRMITESLAAIQEGLREYKGCHVFLAAQGEKMIDIARNSDGAILNFSDPEMIRWAITKLQSVSDAFEIGIFPPTLIVDARQQNDPFSIRASAGVVALGMSMSMKRRFDLREELSYAESLLGERGRLDEDVINSIKKSVTDRFCICDDIKGVCDRMQLYKELGVRTVVFGPPQGATLDGVSRIVQAKCNCD